MSSTTRYVLVVEGCVEPTLYGPFETAKDRDESARKLRNRDEEDGVFWVNVTNGVPQVGSYINGFMEGLEGFPGSEG